MKSVTSILLVIFSIQSFGQCSPTLKEIYDFEVRDDFRYLETHISFDLPTTYTYTKLSNYINYNQSKEDTISYVVSGDYFNQIDTLTLIDSVNHFLNKCEDEYVAISELPLDLELPNFETDSIRSLFIKVTIDSFINEKTKVFSNDQMYKWVETDDSFAVTNTQHCCKFELRYAAKLGCIYKFYDYYEIEASTELYLKQRSDTIFYGGFLSVNDDVNLNLSIFPNPTSSYIIISSPHTIKSIQVSDLTGKTVLTKDAGTQIDISSLTNGFYIIQVETFEGIFHKKIYKK